MEARHFGPLAKGMNGRHQVWIFQAMNTAKKADVSEARDVTRMGVIGAGLMGAGVASVSAGICPVVLSDIDDRNLAKAAKTLDRGLAKQVRSGAIRRSEAHRRWSGLRLTSDPRHLAGADLVVEAVFEDLELKRRVLSELEPLLSDDAVIASNTSALPISDLAAALEKPQRLLGMHYFSPVPKMPLLELVVTPQTARWAIDTARSFAMKQGKTCIVVTDGPGFYTTRILAPMLGEAITLLEEGARTEDVDRAMKDFGFPVGPLALLDEVGVDVGAHVARDLGKAFAERGFPEGSSILRLVEAGYLGRKAGRGFYRYEARRRRGSRPADPEIYRLLGTQERRTVEPGEVQDRLALLMVNEAAHCLADGVVASVADADLGSILGLGFPPFRGGVFHHVDAVGAAAIVDRLEDLAQRLGRRFAPAPPLVDAAKDGRLFYG
jgi:3-hydroxyacyl-CoA dehydrogenase/enoyl-CoA hydratase/3-hydroxybutyryl-CoA epimerase